jgi:hypothetical protein
MPTGYNEFLLSLSFYKVNKLQFSNMPYYTGTNAPEIPVATYIGSKGHYQLVPQFHIPLITGEQFHQVYLKDYLKIRCNYAQLH